MSDPTITSANMNYIATKFVEYLDTAAQPTTDADQTIGYSDLEAAKNNDPLNLVEVLEPGLEDGLTSREALNLLTD